MEFEWLKERVWKFKIIDEKLILYFVISFDRLDYEVYVIFEKMLKDMLK